MRWWLAVFGLAACHQAFGTQHVDELDAADLRLLKPPSEPSAPAISPNRALIWFDAPETGDFQVTP
ncbi:MAG: hypothetical protein ABJE66_00550 [Deltaproteobacteria bacterium]